VNQVDTERRQIHLPKTKNRHPRVVRLNSVAVSALESLGPEKHRGRDPVFPSPKTDVSLQGSRGWFPTAVEAAGIEDFTWHCLRHTTASRLVIVGVDLRQLLRFSAIGPFRWLCAMPISLREHQVDAVDRLVVDSDNRTATKTATGTSGVKRRVRKVGVSHDR
jgi:hypothetical protein